MKVITQEAIEKAGDFVREKLKQHVSLDRESLIFSLLAYDEAFGGELLLIPAHVKRSDTFGAIGGQIQQSCKAVVRWTEIDDPTELETA